MGLEDLTDEELHNNMQKLHKQSGDIMLNAGTDISKALDSQEFDDIARRKREITIEKHKRGKELN